MIKIDLARNIVERMNIHAKDAEALINAFTDAVGDSLTSGEPVRLSGCRHFDGHHSDSSCFISQWIIKFSIALSNMIALRIAISSKDRTIIVRSISPAILNSRPKTR